MDTLKAELDAFYASQPFKQVIESVDGGTIEIHKVKLVKTLPDPLAGISFDAINNLRSALDQACFAIGIANDTNGRCSHFPFGDTQEEVESRRKTSSRDLPQTTFNVIATAKPYKNGNDLLWSLNKLCNSQKHEIVVPMAIATGGGTMHHAYFQEVVSHYWPPRWDPQLNEMILAEVPRGRDCVFSMQVKTFVSFGKVEPVMGKPLFGVLMEMARDVEKIIADLETEARALSLFQ